MTEPQQDVLATVEATQARRVFGVSVLALLGLMVLYISVLAPPSLGWLVFLIVIGVTALTMSWRMWHATAHRIELTTDVLRCSDGTEIVRIDALTHVDRGVFAFKPSNGFIVRAETRNSPKWYPGLWWRFGKRVAIGGVTPGGQAKAMSEIIAALIMARLAQSSQDHDNKEES